MSDFREEEKLGKLYDSHLTRRLLKYLRPYRWNVVLAVSITLGVTAMELLGPYLFKVSIDSYIVPGFEGKLEHHAALQGLLWVVLIYLGTVVCGFAFQYIQVRIMQWVGQQTMYDLRREIFGHLQRIPMSFFDRSPVGRLVTRATTDVDALNDLFASGVVAMLNDFVLLFSMAAFLLKWHALLALATLSPVPLMIVLTYFFRNKVRDANRRIRTAIARINAFLQEHISGIPVVQLFNRERKSKKQFAELNRIHMVAYKDAIDAYSFFFPAVEFLSLGGIALLAWVGGLQAIRGTLEIGVLVAFMIYAQRFFRPIQDLSEKFNILQSAMAASERIFKLLDEPVTIVSPPEMRRLPAPRGEIEFRNVWFAYNGGATPKEEDWVLRDVSFRVEPGQTLAIVGHTGAGKTTVIQLLLRFYDIQRGQILLDGTDIREMDIQELRQLFGIVLQDPFLFTGTLESNVKLGTEHIDRAGTERALREVGLGPFLNTLPQGVETPVTRTRRDAFGGAAAARQLRARSGAQPQVPDPRRGDFERGHENRIADPRGTGPAARRADGRGDCAPAEHHPARASHTRLPQGAPARAGFASRAAGAAWDLLPAIPASIQRAGAYSAPSRRERKRILAAIVRR